MTPCAQCGENVPAGARFCPSCGATQSSASQMPTAFAAGSERASAAGGAAVATIGRLESSGGATAFAAGQVLAERYRIIGLLGRGGMGEVYRADDLKLGQAVSLKFLPRSLGRDPAALESFHSEVRHARQVSHPNVCRVYDIGELDGQQYLTMEYVDGEDLATLLRRIGRLPPTKANEVARQLCAGLAAAHDKGVLHRDLKPSNVMLDGEGRVRITDFGLAVRAEDGRSEMAGTPAYMSPEQFEGRPVTQRSDLYSLGLILYEVYTGKRPFDAASLAEWKNRHVSSSPSSPSTVDPGLDDAVERAIMRCLEKDPSRRPSSALQLAAALPGGDPLAEALAAGDTPSPEMVAAAGGEGAISPRLAWSLLIAALVSIAAVLVISTWSSDLGLAPMTKSRDVLRERARVIVAGLGLDTQPRDSESWFTRDYEPLKYAAGKLDSREWRRVVRSWGPPLAFHYRQSPRWIVPSDNDARVDDDDPPNEISGMTTVVTNADGLLRFLRAVPPQLDTSTVVRPPDWDALFAQAGLDRTKFVAVLPRWTPPEAFDANSEWTGKAPWDPSIDLGVSAAAFHGRPVYFEVRGPWSRPTRMTAQQQAVTRRVANATFAFVSVILLVTGVYFAVRNLRLGRGDSRGGLRLAVVILVCTMGSWGIIGHHVLELIPEFDSFFRALASNVLAGVFVWTVYLALEPFVRRRMPELLIGWARVVEGRFRDARVGRDVLIGACFGCAIALVTHVSNALPAWVPIRGQTTIPQSNVLLEGAGAVVSFLAVVGASSFAASLFPLGTLFVMRLLFRSAVASVIGLAIVLSILRLGGENILLETPGAVVLGVLMTMVVVRYGLLASGVAGLFATTLASIPLPLTATAPYTANSVLCLSVLVILLFVAFRISIGPRPVFALALDE